MDLNYISADHLPHLELEKEEESTEPRKLSSDTGTSLAHSSSTAFDCNICLEFVQDPVVTFCGHLFCWPCIYKWIHFNSISSNNSDQAPQCPVCKAEVSTSAVVPLYGRGKDIVSSEQKAPDFGLAIPERPSAPICVDTSTVSAGQLHLQDQGQIFEPYNPNYHHYESLVIPRLGGTNVFQPILEIFGEIVYSRMFGQPLPNMNGHSDSYNMAWADTPRVRRQLMHAEQSLSRLCFFFFCCMILCLLLF